MSKKVENLRKRYRRLTIMSHDIRHAYRCLLTLKDGDFYERGADVEFDTVFYALNLAMVVAYARPFVHSKGGVDALALPAVPGAILRVYSDAERQLHEELIERRHAEFAHSDAELYAVQTILHSEAGSIVRVNFTQQPVSREKLDILEQMLTKLRSAVFAELSQLGEQLGPGEF